VKLIIEPDDKVTPIVIAIRGAKKSIEISVFRFDRADVEAALKAAAKRGVKVTALIASLNRGGEKNLRRLEMRFLEAGIIVARTADELLRYHDKLILVDRRILYMLSFNFTHVDVDRSRGFGVVTKNAKWVQEAARLFEADCTRTPYTPAMETFVVSPANSRSVLTKFLRRAKKQLLIYDLKITDERMIRILQDRAKAGVEVRIIGRVGKDAEFAIRKISKMRLHARVIIRDRHQAFIGSQSLRRIELDFRRELGLIVRDSRAVKKLTDTFESDWASAETPKKQVAAKESPAAEIRESTPEPPPDPPKMEPERAIQVLVEELHPLAETVKEAVRNVVERAGEEFIEDGTVKATVKKVVKQAVKEAVKEVAENDKKP
jgi:cardiolipin synthase